MILSQSYEFFSISRNNNADMIFTKLKGFSNLNLWSSRNDFSVWCDFLTEKLINGLSSLEGVEKYGGRRGIVYFTVKNIGSEELSKKLDEYGICVRGGFHCAPLMHKYLKTHKLGTVRVSFAPQNTRREINVLLSALKNTTDYI